MTKADITEVVTRRETVSAAERRGRNKDASFQVFSHCFLCFCVFMYFVCKCSSLSPISLSFPPFLSSRTPVGTVDLRSEADLKVVPVPALALSCLDGWVEWTAMSRLGTCRLLVPLTSVLPGGYSSSVCFFCSYPHRPLQRVWHPGTLRRNTDFFVIAV